MTRLRLIATLLIVYGCAAAQHIDVAIAPQMKEYCHIVRFPQGWKVPVEYGKSSTELGHIFHYDYQDDYEFRVPGLQSTRFLVAGLILPENRYTTNQYQVDLSDPKAPILPVSDEAWRAATPVLSRKKNVAAEINLLRPGEPLTIRRVQFQKTGRFWSDTLLSPDETWLTLESYTGSSFSGTDTRFDSSCFPFGCRGKVFLDIFNIDTGKKLLTIQGSYSGGDPEGYLKMKIKWLTERYLIVPLGEHRERCLVCEFSKPK